MFKGGIGCSGEERGREKNKTRPIHARPRSVFPPVNRAADENAIKRKGTAEGITRLARVTSRVYIHIYISLDDSHRFITVVYEKYPDKTYIPTFRLNKKRIIFVGQVFSTQQIYTLGSEGATSLRPLSFLIKPKPES